MSDTSQGLLSIATSLFSKCDTAIQVLKDYPAPWNLKFTGPGGYDEQISDAIRNVASAAGSNVYSRTVDGSITVNTDTTYKTLGDAILSTPAGCTLNLTLKNDVTIDAPINLRGRIVDIRPDSSATGYRKIQNNGKLLSTDNSRSYCYGVYGGALRLVDIHVLTGKKVPNTEFIGYGFVRATDVPTSVLLRSCKVTIQDAPFFNVFAGMFSSIGTEQGGSGTIIEYDNTVPAGERGQFANFRFSGAGASFFNFTLPSEHSKMTEVCTGVLTSGGTALNLVTNISDWSPS